MSQPQKAIRLGDWLLDRGLATQTQLDLALREQKRKGKLLGEALVELGFVTHDTLSQFLAQKTQTESVNLAAIIIPAELSRLIPESLARRLTAVPVSREGDILTVRSNGSKDLVGRCMLVPSLEGVVSYSGFIIRIRPKASVIESRYLLQFMKSAC